MKHPDRITWYLAALLSVAVALALAGAVVFLTVAAPGYIWGKSLDMWWPWFGIPLGSVLGLLSLVSMRVLPEACYRLLGGRRG